MKNKLLKKISIGFAISLGGLTILSSALFLTSCSDKGNDSNNKQENNQKPQAPNNQPSIPDNSNQNQQPENTNPAPNPPVPPAPPAIDNQPPAPPPKPNVPKPNKDQETLNNAISAFNNANLQLKELSKSDKEDIKNRPDGIFDYLLNMPTINRAIQKATTAVPVEDATNHTYTFTITLSLKTLKANTKQFVLNYRDKQLTPQELCEHKQVIFIKHLVKMDYNSKIVLYLLRKTLIK